MRVISSSSEKDNAPFNSSLEMAPLSVDGVDDAPMTLLGADAFPPPPVERETSNLAFFVLVFISTDIMTEHNYINYSLVRFLEYKV